MGQPRKLPEPETLAKHIADGMSLDHIASTYGCLRSAVRLKLVHHGLVTPKKHAPDPATAGLQEPAEPDAAIRVTVESARTVIERPLIVQGIGKVRRCVSLPPNSMHLMELAKRHPELRRV